MKNFLHVSPKIFLNKQPNMPGFPIVEPASLFFFSKGFGPSPLMLWPPRVVALHTMLPVPANSANQLRRSSFHKLIKSSFHEYVAAINSFNSLFNYMISDIACKVKLVLVSERFGTSDIGLC